MCIAQTERLTIRKLTEQDAEFILKLLNEPDFLKYIGDKKVRTHEDAIEYLQKEVIDSYQTNGYGPYLVERTDEQQPVGICSLKKREELSMPDLGFAFLKRHRSNGYATEASLAVMQYASSTLGINSISAITSPQNSASIGLLKKLGFQFQENIKLPGFETETKLFTAKIK